MPGRYRVAMVTELADITVTDVEGFPAAFRRGAVHLDGAGARSVRLTRSVESPARFVLLVEWDTVADHQAFRDSDAFGLWRAEVGPFFAGPPTVEHLEDVPTATAAG